MPSVYTDPQKLYIHFPHHPVEPLQDDYHCPCCPDHGHDDFHQMDGIWADITYEIHSVIFARIMIYRIICTKSGMLMSA
jgi:hypothetical protein